MSSREYDDDQIRWENRREDENYARIQADRRSEIAKGFSHDTDALRALYGVQGGQSRSRESQTDAFSMLLERKDHVLRGLSEWPAFDPVMLGITFPRKDELHRKLCDIRLSGPIADIELRGLIQWMVDTEARLDNRCRLLPSHDRIPAIASYARWISLFRQELEELLRDLNHHNRP